MDLRFVAGWWAGVGAFVEKRLLPMGTWWGIYRNNIDPQGGYGKTIALVNKEDYLVLASTIGLDIALNAKISAANELAFTFEVLRVKGVQIPKANSISFLFFNLCIRLLSSI